MKKLKKIIKEREDLITELDNIINLLNHKS